MRRLLLTAAVVLLATAPAYAGDAGRETPFALGAGARSLGLGGGLTALATDATAMYYNPAGLSQLEYQELFFSHSVLFEHSAFDVATWVYPIDQGHGVGVSYMRLGTGDIVRRQDYADLGTFDYSQSQLMLAYGRRLAGPLSGGATLKIVNQAIDDKSDFAVGLDVGGGLELCRWFSIGVIARDVMPAKLTLDSTGEKAPPSVTAGLAFKGVPLSRFTTVTATLDVEKFEDRDFKVHTGAEIRFYNHYALRAGYDRDNVVVGAGLRHGRVAIDYAYKLVDYVDDVHHISFSLFLGKSLQERIRLRELSRRPPEPTEEEKHFASVMNRANAYLRRFQLDSAEVAFREALALRPNDQEIVGSLAALAEARRVQREQEARLQAAEDELTQTLSSFLTQAELLFARKSYAAALDILSLIFDIQPDNLRARSLSDQIRGARDAEIAAKLVEAQAASREGRVADAIEAYNRVLEIDPANQQAQDAKQQLLAAMDLPEKIRLGIAQFERGNYDEARARFQAVLRINPQEPVALDYLKRISEAQTKVSTLEDLQKDKDIWALYLEGLRFMRNKEYQNAIDAWTQVLKAYPNNPNTLNNIEQARLRLKTEQPGE